jgi:hypothetical protein
VLLASTLNPPEPVRATIDAASRAIAARGVSDTFLVRPIDNRLVLTRGRWAAALRGYHDLFVAA